MFIHDRFPFANCVITNNNPRNETDINEIEKIGNLEPQIKIEKNLLRSV